MEEKTRAHLLISGRVQGVCFRMEAEQEATRLGIVGWVRNTPEGKVEALFEGDSEKVEQMIQWCHKGPAQARVGAVKVQREPYRGNIADFRIAR